MHLFSKAFLFFAVLIISVCGKTPGEATFTPEDSKNIFGLDIKYIGNEGVLISSGDRQILIDGLHRQYKPAYAFPPPAMLKSMESAAPPYDKINLLLISHIHLDHFHPESIGLYLKNNPKSELISSLQVEDEISKKFVDYEQVKSRIRGITPEWKQKTVVEREGIRLNILGLKHSNAQHASIQNLGHLIELNGKKLLHIGDADMTPENFSSFELSKENIDVAFIPYWFLTSENGRALVKDQFNPKHIIAVHVSPSEAEKISLELKKHYSDITVFTKISE